MSLPHTLWEEAPAPQRVLKPVPFGTNSTILPSLSSSNVSLLLGPHRNWSPRQKLASPSPGLCVTTMSTDSPRLSPHVLCTQVPPSAGSVRFRGCLVVFRPLTGLPTSILTPPQPVSHTSPTCVTQP